MELHLLRSEIQCLREDTSRMVKHIDFVECHMSFMNNIIEKFLPFLKKKQDVSIDSFDMLYNVV